MTDIPDKAGDNAEELTALAFEALDDGNLEAAQSLATRLRDLRYSSYFEIQALIYLGSDEMKSAIKVLREGVGKAPRVWRLWQLLGNTLSDADDLKGAMRCYETALPLELDAEALISLQFNRATLLSRMNRATEALGVLNEMETTISSAPLALQWRFGALRMRVLTDLGRQEEVLKHAEALEQKLLEVDDVGEEAESFSVAWAQGGLALFDCGENPWAREWAQHSLEWDRTNGDALQLLRKSNGAAPRATRYFQVMLEGDWDDVAHESDEELGFFTTFMVVARDSEEAKRWALEMEAPRWGTLPRVEECQEINPCDETAAGVYEVGPYHLFPRENEEDANDEPNSHA